MTLDLKEPGKEGVIEIHASDKLTREDYDRFMPKFDELIRERGKNRVLFVMNDFHGWTAGAMADDIKLAFKHLEDIDRIVLVGDKKWQQYMGTLCNMFTKTDIRFMTHDRIQEARFWLSADPVRQEEAQHDST